MNLRIGTLVSIHVFLVGPFAFADHEIGYSESFSPNDRYTAEWCAEDETLHFRVEAQVTGWVGFGFSDDQLMANSDVVMATGEGAIQDSWATGRSAPPADASQDVTLHSSSQIDGKTVVEFSRPRVTEDARDLSLDGERFVVWATSSSNDRFTSKHSTRGFSSSVIDFGSAAACAVPDPVAPLDDGTLTDPDERRAYVHDVLGTWIGDSNLDGEFNSSDLVDVFIPGKYEVDVVAGWREGDWDGSMRFGSGDFVVSFADGGYESGPMAAQAVPEPSALLLLSLGFIALCGRRR